MKLVDRTLAEHPDITAQRSTKETVLASVCAAVLFGVGILVLVNMEAISDWFLQANGRRSGFAPVVTPLVILLCFGGGLATIRYAIKGAYEFVRTDTGHKVPSKLALSMNAKPDAAKVYYQRFASKNPKYYVPLPMPRGNGGGKVHISVWMVPEEKVAYASIAYGKAYAKDSDATTRYPLITFTGAEYEAMELVRRNTWFKPAPEAALKLVHGASS